MARKMERKFSGRQEEIGVEVSKLKPKACHETENQIFKDLVEYLYLIMLQNLGNDTEI